MLSELVFGVFLVSFVIQLIYHIYFHVNFTNYVEESLSFKKGVSVIICAKNEIKNLENNLPIILNQEYADYEVILVNDQSGDNSKYILKNMQIDNSKLVVVNIEDNVKQRAGKKFALTLGIKTAKYDHLLLTDADCLIRSKKWLSNMVNGFASKDIVLGYSNYEELPGLLNKLIRFDTFNIGLKYLSYALRGKTYMGVGRNLGYKKSLFFKNKGFASHIYLASGDDDLFIQEVATKENTHICINPEAHTVSESIRSWKAWIHQKRRHITTSVLYPSYLKIYLSIWPLSQLVFWISLFLLLFLENFLSYILIALLLKLIMSYVIHFKTMNQLKVKDLYLFHPFYELLHLISQVIFVLLNVQKKPKDWS